VQNSLYDAQYGRGGGATVDVETRSERRSCMGAPITSAATKSLMRTISLRTQPECQEESSGVPSPAAHWVGRSRGRSTARFSLVPIKPPET
jgi:hypothetical protein